VSDFDDLGGDKAQSMMNKNRKLEIKVVPWNEPTDLREKSYETVIQTWVCIMFSLYVGILHRDPKSISIGQRTVRLHIS
jgi:hypothetical protein